MKKDQPESQKASEVVVTRLTPDSRQAIDFLAKKKDVPEAHVVHLSLLLWRHLEEAIEAGGCIVIADQDGTLTRLDLKIS